ncbi:hypothetical protein [Vibrio sp.]|uniref:hypothetical protein n=1 Tax=Vibrio sp. TaxID=678 RepID=UPI00311E6C7B
MVVSENQYYFGLGESAMIEAVAHAEAQASIGNSGEINFGSIYDHFEEKVAGAWDSMSELQKTSAIAGGLATAAQKIVSKIPLANIVLAPSALTKLTSSLAHLTDSAKSGTVKPSEVTAVIGGIATIIGAVAAAGAVAVAGTASAVALGTVVGIAGAVSIGSLAGGVVLDWIFTDDDKVVLNDVLEDSVNIKNNLQNAEWDIDNDGIPDSIDPDINSLGLDRMSLDDSHSDITDNGLAGFTRLSAEQVHVAASDKSTQNVSLEVSSLVQAMSSFESQEASVSFSHAAIKPPMEILAVSVR